MKYLIVVFSLLVLFSTSVFAIEDPRNTPNNKVGIGVLSPEADLDEAASLVNTNGQWGWVLLTVKRSEMNVDRWQAVFHRLSKLKLIPIVRIATDFDSSGSWSRPGNDDASNWADFLSKLYWPTKNRYIQVYNEVNRATEWGGNVDPEGYARELDKTISALKGKSDDFFILNAPLDLALADSTSSMDAARYFDLMEQASNGIFTRIDGWASHSYPNPNFSASPDKSGRTGIDGYRWELLKIDPYVDGKDLPVFITETGWDRSKVDEATIANYFEKAFANVWSDPEIVAVTPFVLDYPDGLYNSFSFKSNGGEKKYFEHFFKIRDLAKAYGLPKLENVAEDFKVNLLPYVMKGADEFAQISIKNGGNLIWKTDELKVHLEGADTQIVKTQWKQSEVYPGQVAVGTVYFKTLSEGAVNFTVKAFFGDDLLAQDSKSATSETFVQRVFRVLDQLV